jgi:excisionase family DNA binding protein
MMEPARIGCPSRALLAPKEVAELLGVNENTLYKWRAAGEGPPYMRLTEGGRVRYERDSLRAWMIARLARVTSSSF